MLVSLTIATWFPMVCFGSSVDNTAKHVQSILHYLEQKLQSLLGGVAEAREE